MNSADRLRRERRAARRLDLAIREHRYRADVRRELTRPHDSAPTIPPTAPPASESEQDR